MRCRVRPPSERYSPGLTAFGCPMLRVLNCFLVITFLATLPALARDEAPARVGRAASSRATSQSTCRTKKNGRPPLRSIIRSPPALRCGPTPMPVQRSESARTRREAPRRALSHFSEHDGVRRSRRLSPVGSRRRLSRGLVSECAGRLGALHARPLGLDRAVGLDLGRRRARGICAVALRALAFTGDRWCRVPGSFEPSPVYAPALVAKSAVISLSFH
jgi:hypothetical protein